MKSPGRVRLDSLGSQLCELAELGGCGDGRAAAQPYAGDGRGPVLGDRTGYHVAPVAAKTHPSRSPAILPAPARRPGAVRGGRHGPRSAGHAGLYRSWRTSTEHIVGAVGRSCPEYAQCAGDRRGEPRPGGTVDRAADAPERADRL